MNQKNYAQNRTKASRENIKQTKKSEEKENLLTITFEIPASLRHSFKAKVSAQGKKIKDVLLKFIEDYVKN